SRILQSLTVAHTWSYHRRHGSVGHVWQGRFKSPVVQDDEHLLIVLRYIEANPLRAGMVTDLRSYPWTSYAAHGLGRADPLLSAVPAWSGLAATEDARQKYWRRWGQGPLGARGVAAVRKSGTRGRAFGTGAWGARMGQQLGMPA